MNRINRYEPEIYGIIAALFLLSIWYFSSLAIDKSIIPTSYKFIFDIFAYSFSAFIGAFSAFSLNNLRAEKSIRSQQIALIDHTLLKIITQIQYIRDIDADLELVKNEQGRFLNLRPFKTIDTTRSLYDLGGLAFLIGKGNPNIILRLTTLEENYELYLWAINQRSSFHAQEFQPAASKEKFPKMFRGNKEQLIEIFGEYIIETLVSQTDEIYRMHEPIEGKMHEMLDDIRKMAKEIYPEHKFVKLL